MIVITNSFYERKNEYFVNFLMRKGEGRSGKKKKKKLKRKKKKKKISKEKKKKSQ